jgi:hypothetical protein
MSGAAAGRQPVLPAGRLSRPVDCQPGLAAARPGMVDNAFAHEPRGVAKLAPPEPVTFTQRPYCRAVSAVRSGPSAGM